MKKFLAFVACATLMLSTGCEKKNSAAKPDLDKVFTVQSSITADEFEAKAEISRLGGGLWEMEFSNPETLSGIKLSFNGTDINASYQGLSFSVPEEILPKQPMFKKLFECVDKTVTGEEIPFSENEGILTFENEIDEIGRFKISTEKNTGFLKSIEIPSEKLKVDFNDFEEIE